LERSNELTARKVLELKAQQACSAEFSGERCTEKRSRRFFETGTCGEALVEGQDARDDLPCPIAATRRRATPGQVAWIAEARLPVS
jgi:hypothetical protein